MKNSLRFILYLLTGLIFIGGIFLIIYGDEVGNYLQTQNNLTVVIPAAPKKILVQDSIDSGILSAPRLATLVNNVVNFNFDNICWRPDTVLSRSLNLINTASTTATSTVKTPLANCVQGNGLPFAVKIK